MTPARTLTLALICACAFTYDLTQKEHNCTISNEENRVCNITAYESNENSNSSIEVKLVSNNSNEKNDLDVLYIGDNRSGLYYASLSRNNDIDDNSTNIINADNHNWTNSEGKHLYDKNLQRLNENIFVYNEDLQARYLAVSDHVRGNVRRAFDETLFSGVPQDDILYELSDEQYYAMPRVFELDDYPSCVGERGAYCLGSFELAPIGRSTLFSVMQRFSANWVDNFNHTRLHRGVCLQRSCSPPTHERDLDAWFESCVNASTVSTYNLTARLYHLNYCTSGDDMSPPLNASQKAFVAFVVLVLLLTVVGTALDVMMPDAMKNVYGWALSWSLISSWRYLTAPAPVSRGTDLRFFDGLRVFCMLSVIVEHVCWLGTQAYVADTRYVELTRTSSDAMLLANSTVMVQIFFLMSSFLLAHKLLQEQQRHSSVAIFFKMMFNRIIRISPSYFIVVWFASSWWERLGDGPQWRSLVHSEAAVCRRKWWEQLLYVSNLVNTDDKCLIQTWYLAADMQLYALSLALTLWLRRSARRALAVLGLAAAALIAGNLAVAYALRLVPTVVVHNPESIRAAYKGEASFDWMYTSAQSNGVSALAGLLLAHVRCAGAAPHALAGRRWFRFLSVWAVPVTAVVVAVWPHLLGAGPPPRLPAAASAALERPVFITLVTIALFGALSGVDSPWARWMSRGTAAARLSFGALLLHMLLIKSFLATRLAPVHLDRLSVYIEWFGFSVLSYLAAIPLALLVEFPAQRLHKEITILVQTKYKQMRETKTEKKTKVN